MAHLWHRDDDAAGWEATPLRAASYALAAGRPVPLPFPGSAAAELHDAAGLWGCCSRLSRRG
ncbi:MAG: hypothetical protein U0802_23390 [Candidatus Binatia bacterium]